MSVLNIIGIGGYIALYLALVATVFSILWEGFTGQTMPPLSWLDKL